MSCDVISCHVPNKLQNVLDDAAKAILPCKWRYSGVRLRFTKVANSAASKPIPRLLYDKSMASVPGDHMVWVVCLGASVSYIVVWTSQIVKQTHSSRVWV